MSIKKKIAFLIMTLSVLSGCAEKDQFQEAVLTQLKDDQDLKDYKIDPERMADCVVDTSSRNMPGAFPLDSERKKSYLAYTKMLTVAKSTNPQEVIKELRAQFGSAQALSNAHSNYTESILTCQTALASEVADNAEAETEKNLATTENPAKLMPEQTNVTVENGMPPSSNTTAIIPSQTQPKMQ